MGTCRVNDGDRDESGTGGTEDGIAPYWYCGSPSMSPRSSEADEGDGLPVRRYVGGEMTKSSVRRVVLAFVGIRVRNEPDGDVGDLRPETGIRD